MQAETSAIADSTVSSLQMSCSEMIYAKRDCTMQPFSNIPLIKVVVWVQTQNMPVIQAKRFELPHPQLRQSTGQNSNGIQ